MSELPAGGQRQGGGGHGSTRGGQGQSGGGQGAVGGGRGSTADVPRDIPGDRPPRRLLERAPSARLAEASAATPAIPAGSVIRPAGSAGRAIAYGTGVALVGALVHLGAATLLLWTAELLVVAATIGILVGLAVAFGARGSLRPRTRRGLAVVLALGSIALGAGLGWALSGMYLGPLDYLDQVYGLLVPVQLVLAAAGALAGSR